MSGHKRWVSSKVYRKISSKTSLSSHQSSPPTDDPHCTSPLALHAHLPRRAALVDFSGQAPFPTQRDSEVSGRPGSHEDRSESSATLDSVGTQNPSATPPKKTWEMN